jgi:hypothetical protein
MKRARATRSAGDRDPASPRTATTVPQTLAFLFAPVHKRAMGTAVGLTCALGVFAVTAIHVLFRPDAAIDLTLLAQYFHGYAVSWQGAAIGAFWGFMTGFVAGWFVGFVRNLVVAAYMFIIRTKTELLQSKDFLDHI